MVIQLMTFTLYNYGVTANFFPFAKFGRFEHHRNKKTLESNFKTNINRCRPSHTVKILKNHHGYLQFRLNI